MRWFLAVLALAMASLPAGAVEIYGCYTGSAQQGGHRLTTGGIQSSQYAQQSFPAATVTVLQHGTLIPAAIFADASGTSLPNPFTSSSTGVAFWCAADGKYDVQYSGPSITSTFSVSDIPICFACAGGGGGSGTVGPGTVNHLLRFTTSTTAGDSVCTDDGITPMACSLGINLVSNALFIQKPNNQTTGTTVNLLVSRDAAGLAINAQPTDTNNLIGIAGFNAGISGNVSIAYVGQFACQFDNQTAIADWVILGANSQCHDAGAVEPTATQNLGRVASINGGAGTLATVDLGLPDVTSASSGGGGGNGTVNNCNTPGSNTYYNVAGNTVDCDSSTNDDGAGNLSANSYTLTGAGAGFVAFVQGAAPTLTAANAAYWHAPLLVGSSFDTAVPSAPGTAGEILAVDNVIDATHITTKWTTVTGTGTVTSSGPPSANQLAVFTTSTDITGTASDTNTAHALFATATVPAFRAIVAGDIPTLNQNTSGTAANLSGTPTLPNGTAGATQAPGDNTTKLATDAFVIANASVPCTTCVTSASALTNHGVVVGNGLQASATITADTNTTHFLAATATDPAFRAIVAGDIPTLNQNTSGTAANVSGTPALPNGTSATTQTPGDNTTKIATDAFVLANVGTVTASGGTLTANTVLLGNGTTDIKVAATDTTTTHAFFATATAPAFRAIAAGDIPTLNQNTSGTAANLSGTPALPNGTTATTQSLADNSTKLATTAFVLANAGSAPPFSSITSGTNANALHVGTAGSLDATGTGTIDATTLLTKTWASPAAIGTGTPAAVTGTTGVFSSLNGAVFANASTTVQQAMTAASTNGLSMVTPTYAGGDIPIGTQLNDIYIPASSSQPAGAKVVDYRYGNVLSMFNPPTTASSPSNVSVPSGVIGNFTQLPSATSGYNEFMFSTQLNAYDGGSNLFGTAGSSNKTTYAPFTTFLNAWTPGQHIAGGATVNGYGAGDNLAFNMVAQGWGGSNARSDEGVHLGDWAVESGNVAYVGTVASGGTAGSTSVTITPSAGSGTQGAGRFLIDTTSGSAVTITTIAGSGPLTYTASGTPFTAGSTTTDSTAITTVGSHLINVGSTTGITANTTLVAIYDNQSAECVIPSAVNAGVSITATFRRTYASGANLAWGSPQVCQFISLDADRWTTTGAIAFTNVLNTLRQAWLIVGAPSTSTLTVWYNTGGGYGTYGGNAKASAGSNAATIYPGAEVVSVQSGGTFSNTFTLAPNTVTFSTHAVEEPLYPGQKMLLSNTQVFKAFHSAGSQGFGGGPTLNGNFNGGDCFWCITDNAANTLYTGHSGNENPPIAYLYLVNGLVRNGIAFDEHPDTTIISSGCPVNSSGSVDCTLSSDDSYKIASLNGNGGIDYFSHNPATGSFRVVGGHATVGWKFDGATGNFVVQNGGITTSTGTGSVTIAHGTAVLGTGAITSGTCATVVTTAATGVATTDVVRYGFNGDPTGITGYAPSASGMLTIITYPTSNNVNVKICNNTASSITPGAVTLNWQVIR